MSKNVANVDDVAVAVVTKDKKRIKKTECENERMSGRKGDRQRERERERERERDYISATSSPSRVPRNLGSFLKRK